MDAVGAVARARLERAAQQLGALAHTDDSVASAVANQRAGRGGAESGWYVMSGERLGAGADGTNG